MMTWKQREAEERFYRLDGWYWNSDEERCYRRTIADELTIDEAEDLINALEITADSPQYDVLEEHRDSCEKILCKDECGLRTLGEF